MFDDNEEENFNGDLKEDVKRFEAFLKGSSMGFLDSDRWEALIDHFVITGQYSKVLTCADEALTQFSYNNQFKLRKAQAFSGLGKLKESLNLLSELESFGMSSFELTLTKASVFSQLKDSNSAIKYFKMALEMALPEDRDEVYLDLAMEYQNIGKYQLAINVLKEAIKVNPRNEGAVYEIAHCFEQLGDFTTSVQCYSDYIDENPYSFTAWYNLGNAYSRLENYEKAIWAYDYCLLINDKFGPVYFNLGNAYLGLEKYTKAIESFGKCVELDGEDPIALCYLGECHEQLNELELASHYYKRSVELAPSLPDAWLGLGIVLDLEGKTREGVKLILKALELDPENSGIHHVLAGAYEKMNERDEAQQHYESSLLFDPYDEECLINYTDFLKEVSIMEALNFLEAHEKITDDRLITSVIKVNLYWDLGKKQDSLNLFKVCLEEDREKANELFEINPALKNVKEFVLLGDQ